MESSVVEAPVDVAARGSDEKEVMDVDVFGEEDDEAEAAEASSEHPAH